MNYRKYKITLQLKTPDGMSKAVYVVDIDNNSVKDEQGIGFRTLDQKDAVHSVLFKMIEFLKMGVDWKTIKADKIGN
jgi:hypothetical protein